jgi:hypothetical protein
MSNQPIKVFISYSHDSEQHKEWVLALSNTLRQHGIDCQIDQYVTFVEEGWMLWMQQQIENADFVLLVCTKKYLANVGWVEEQNPPIPYKKGPVAAKLLPTRNDLHSLFSIFIGGYKLCFRFEGFILAKKSSH